jgi:hypothetical protein
MCHPFSRCLSNLLLEEKTPKNNFLYVADMLKVLLEVSQATFKAEEMATPRFEAVLIRVLGSLIGFSSSPTLQIIAELMRLCNELGYHYCKQSYDEQKYVFLCNNLI